MLGRCLAPADEHAEHHLGLGVGKIYVMDQASSPPLSTVLGRHIASGAVEYEWLAGVPPLPPPPSPGVQPLWDFSYNGGRFFQLYAYDRCLELHRQKHTWMGAQAAGAAGEATGDLPPAGAGWPLSQETAAAILAGKTHCPAHPLVCPCRVH